MSFLIVLAARHSSLWALSSTDATNGRAPRLFGLPSHLKTEIAHCATDPVQIWFVLPDPSSSSPGIPEGIIVVASNTHSWPKAPYQQPPQEAFENYRWIFTPSSLDSHIRNVADGIAKATSNHGASAERTRFIRSAYLLERGPSPCHQHVLKNSFVPVCNTSGVVHNGQQRTTQPWPDNRAK